MRDRNQWGRQREHSGYSNYAGGGDRDRDMHDRRDWFLNRNDMNDYDDRPRNLGARDYEARHFGPGRFESDLGFGYPQHEGREGIDRDDRGPHYGKGPKGYKRSDERIREDVCETIARQGHIDASDVEVKVVEAVVTLSGTVGMRHQKRALEQMVEHVHGVEDVRNELRLQRNNEAATSQKSPQQNGPNNGRVARS